MTRFSITIVAVFFMAAAAFAQQGAPPISREQYDATPKWQPERQATSDMPRIDLRGYMPAIGNQIPQNSCTAWATAYAAKSYLEVIDQGWTPDRADRVFSPAFVYNRLNAGKNLGVPIVNALELLKKEGCATWATMPYDPRDFTKQPSRDAIAEAAKFRCLGYQHLSDGPSVRKALQQGHVVILNFRTDPEFRSGKYKIFTKEEKKRGDALRPAGTVDDYHAVCVVGYDDVRQAFLIMNSWGQDWGQSGCCWVSYDLMRSVFPHPDNFAQEAWVLLDIKQRFTTTGDPVATDSKEIGTQGYFSYCGYQGNAPLWSWTAYIDAQQQTLANVDRVVWSIPDGLGGATPFENRDIYSAFGVAWTASGSGVLEVAARVFFKDNTTKDLTYRFNFPAPSRNLSLIMTDRYLGRSGDQPFWEWTLSIDGGLIDLGDIRQVTYHLHPSFPNPDLVVNGTAENGFAFTTSGWGSFKVGATVLFLDGATQELSLNMQFKDPIRDTLSLTNISSPMGADSSGQTYYSWTAYVDGPLHLLRQISAVRYFLHPTFSPNVRDVTYGAEYGFPLSTYGWGRFELKATVYFQNGATQDLSHRLDFSHVTPRETPEKK
ncbi:MAG: C1 family peptidase [Planctomycetota bacterium]|nr:C1 family peptidase [Planctomycetota bacterium]